MLLNDEQITQLPHVVRYLKREHLVSINYTKDSRYRDDARQANEISSAVLVVANEATKAQARVIITQLHKTLSKEKIAELLEVSLHELIEFTEVE